MLLFTRIEEPLVETVESDMDLVKEEQEVTLEFQ